MTTVFLIHVPERLVSVEMKFPAHTWIKEKQVIDAQCET